MFLSTYSAYKTKITFLKKSKITFLIFSRNIYESFNCTEFYIGTCEENPTCDAVCKILIQDLKVLFPVNGLLDLTGDLCDEHSKIRESKY